MRRGIAAVQRAPLIPATLIIVSEKIEDSQAFLDLPALEELLQKEIAF